MATRFANKKHEIMIHEGILLMQIASLLVVSIALYWISSKIIDLAEQARGGQFEHRTIYFFFLLLSLSLATFWVIRRLGGS